MQELFLKNYSVTFSLKFFGTALFVAFTLQKFESVATVINRAGKFTWQGIAARAMLVETV